MNEADLGLPAAAAGTQLSLQTHVIKLGGSLLSHPQLVVRLRQWLEVLLGDPRPTTGPTTRLVWIVGGGLLADAIRQWDQLHQLGERRCHELCLELLSTTARVAQPLIAQALGFSEAASTVELPLLTSWQELRAWQQEPRGAADARDVRETHRCRSAIFDVGRVLRDEPAAEGAAELPSSWDVTSDTLAAWVTGRLDRLAVSGSPSADRTADTITGEITQLTLLKSCPPPLPATRAAAQEAGIVDVAFRRFAATVSRVTHVQLVGGDRASCRSDAGSRHLLPLHFPAAVLS
jgi:aspartokinase-like uncharacterized kinase